MMGPADDFDWDELFSLVGTFEDAFVAEGNAATPTVAERVPRQPPRRHTYDPKRKPRCKHCHSTDVFWDKLDGIWRLRDKKTLDPHSCVEYRLAKRAAEQSRTVIPEGTEGKQYWLIRFYEPDESPDEHMPFAERKAYSHRDLDIWLQHAKEIRAKVNVRCITECELNYGTEDQSRETGDDRD